MDKERFIVQKKIVRVEWVEVFVFDYETEEQAIKKAKELYDKNYGEYRVVELKYVNPF